MSARPSRLTVTWLELTVDCDRDAAVTLGDLFTEAGANSVSFSNASEEIVIESASAALWRQTRVRALFPGNADVPALKRKLEAAGFGPPQTARFEEQDWENAWRQHVEPRRYGHRLWVLPTFADPSAYDGICVRMDPGLAFGAGSHATTALCLEWLEGEALAGRRVIDYGCGSGILAIAAVMLGARSARCVDNDAGALLTARENARSNGVDDYIEFYSPETLPPAPADVLVANILAGTLIELAGKFADLLKPEGRIALCGILEDQAEAVAYAYSDYICFDASERRGDWIRLAGSRRGASHP